MEKKIRILCRIAATFRDSGMTFYVRANDRLVILDAPEWIRRDPLFDWLVKDGSLEVIQSRKAQKEAENNPAKDTNAEGKKTAEKGEKKPEESKQEGAVPDASK